MSDIDHQTEKSQRKEDSNADDGIIQEKIKEEWNRKRGRVNNNGKDKDDKRHRQNSDVQSEKDSEQKRIQETRRNLPIYSFREDLISAVNSGQTLIVIGETGSGKSTQISQFLLEEGYGKKGVIGITQPRRVGAVSVARRVAEEVGCRIGDQVGYSVRFGDKTSSRTEVKYMTDGVLLRECLLDPDLKKYSVIILDEAHERSVNTDILFGLMKIAIARRPDLKVLITSATLESDKFSVFFNSCRVFFVPGRSYPVDVFYLEDKTRDYVDKALSTVIQIHENEPDGDVLVFLTGQGEIDDACNRLEKMMYKVYQRNPDVKDLLIVPLYAALPPGDQVKVFAAPPPNARKVVIATNIAETSLTVEGIVYVVDPGFVKQKGFNPTTGMETLEVHLISQVAAQQRAGRAGRTRPGKCYRLYTKQAYEEMAVATVPEIQRANLSNVILTLKAMGVEDVLSFEFLDQPDPILLIQALKTLYYLGALDEKGKLTEMGKHMSVFPLDPSYSRMLMASLDLKCSEEMLTIVAMMSIENLFYRPSQKKQQEEADERRRDLFEDVERSLTSNLTGDHLFLLHTFESWIDSGKSAGWCRENFIQPRHMEEISEIRKQLIDIMKEEKLEILSSSRDKSTKYERLSRAICQGLFMNYGKRVTRNVKQKPKRKDDDDEESDSSHSEYSYLVMNKGQLAFVHPQSALLFSRKQPPEVIVYSELVLTSRIFMRMVCGVKIEWIEELLTRKTKLDVNKLIGRDIREVISTLTAINTPSQKVESKYHETNVEEKFARRNTDDKVEEARQRALARRQAKK